MTNNEKEIMNMVETRLASGNFSRTATVRVRFSACGYSVKIGAKAFESHLLHVWDCVPEVERLGCLGYDIHQAMNDIETLS
jgi:hypothetical protein